MAIDDYSRELSAEEERIKKLWKRVIKYIRKDLAYIWTDEVKRDFEGLEAESERILVILRRFHNHYSSDNKKYKKEISDVHDLIAHLEKATTPNKWIRQIHDDVIRVIADIESEKSTIKRISRRKFIKLALMGAGALAAQKVSKPVYDYFTKGGGEASRLNAARLTDKIRRMINNRDFPNMNNSIDPNLWASVITESYAIATGRNIEANSEYQNIILTLIYFETGFRTVKKLISWLPIPEFRGTSEGPMQIRTENLKDSKNIKEILAASIQHLEKIIRIYTTPERVNERLLPYIFADWNAGAFSCRNAVIQVMLNKRVKPTPNLVVDGDLGPLSTKALKQLNAQEKLGINESQIDEELKPVNIENFYNGGIYSLLVRKYPELNTPFLVDAKVEGFFRKIRALLSYETSSSKEYSEQAMIVYNKIKIL